MRLHPGRFSARSAVASADRCDRPSKNQDIERGLGQCLAQMIAARQFKQSTGVAFDTVYGCVTTGETWQFIRLVESTAQLAQRRFYIDNVSGILAAFQAIFAECHRFLSAAA